MDPFSRLIVGWAAQPTIHRELVLNAVLMAVRRRRPRGTLIHSDQGTQSWQRCVAPILPCEPGSKLGSGFHVWGSDSGFRGPLAKPAAK